MRSGLDGIPGIEDDDRLRLEGPQRVTVRVGTREVAVSAAPGRQLAQVAHQGPGNRVYEQLWKVERARRQAVAVARSAGRRLAGEVPQSDLIALGQALGEQFLAGPAGELLAAQLAEAERRNAALRIALDVEADPQLQALPWETLCLPGSDQPLVLHPRSQLHRVVRGLGSTPAILIPEPLRILAAIGVPETDGEEVLDYEAELDRIVMAVDRARIDGRALVRVLDWGTASAIRDALREERFHVLHISCRASAGALVLETADGRPDLVGIRRLATELLVPGRGVPLIVLAGSHTAVGPGDPDADGGEVPSLARELLSHGVPAVLAMAAEVERPVCHPPGQPLLPGAGPRPGRGRPPDRALRCPARGRARSTGTAAAGTRASRCRAGRVVGTGAVPEDGSLSADRPGRPGPAVPAGRDHPSRRHHRPGRIRRPA